MNYYNNKLVILSQNGTISKHYNREITQSIVIHIR